MNLTRSTNPAVGALAARLQAVAAEAGCTLHPAGSRRFTCDAAAGGRVDLSLRRGWFCASRPWESPDGPEPLALHRDWSGPAKIEQNGACVVNLQLPLGEHSALTGDDDWSDDAALAAGDRFWLRLFDQLPDWMQGRADPAWEPPPAVQLSEWLTAAGHTVAIDEQGSLRTVLKRKACDGQVLIERRTGRLRFVMRLGAWSNLAPAASDAIRLLLRIANHRTRLVRMTWSEQDGTGRAEAVVDLSGLPVGDDSEPVVAAVWSEVLPAALDGLQLTLDRLGLELDALADPENADVVEAFLAQERPGR